MPMPSSFQPAEIPKAVRDVGGKPYMADARGALVPLDMVKATDKLIDDTVRSVMGYALALSRQIERFKAHTMVDLDALDAVLAEQYRLVKRGNQGKGNRTYTTHDALFRVTVNVADFIEFGPELQIAKGLIDECLNEWAADARDEIRAIVTKAFNTESQGRINRSEIFMLLRLDIQDERWGKAMTAIRDAMRVVGRKEYVRFAMRSSPEAGWVTVTIDLAQA